MAVVPGDLATQWSTLFETLFLQEFNTTLVVERVVFFARAEKATDKDAKAAGDVKPGAKVDARYLGWGSSVGGLWYPASEEVYVDDRLARRTLVKTVEKGVPVDAGLFR